MSGKAISRNSIPRSSIIINEKLVYVPDAS